jgi:flavin-dependent dehydrogenase
MTFDLAIIGGGPAGCAAAITAARHGTRVLLLEKGRFPRHKVCGEFVSAESLGLLASLLVTNFEDVMSQAPRISKARIFGEDHPVCAEIRPFAASIPRFVFDAALWSACLSCGVECLADAAVRSVEGNGPFRVSSDQAIFEAKALINAAGRWSLLTSTATRACITSEKWLGIKAHFIEDSATDSVDLYFFEGGYCGVQPVCTAEPGSARRVNACAMVRADIARTMPEVLKQHHALASRSSKWIPSTEPVATSPLIFHKPEPVQQTMIQAGDAATFVDPFIGDGISLALRSGALAAKCLFPFLDGQCSLQKASDSYAREYRRRFERVFKASSGLRWVMNWPRGIREPILSVMARMPSIANQVVRMTR